MIASRYGFHTSVFLEKNTDFNHIQCTRFPFPRLVNLETADLAEVLSSVTAKRD